MPRGGSWLRGLVGLAICMALAVGCGPEAGTSSGDGAAEATGSMSSDDDASDGASDSGGGADDSTGATQPEPPPGCTCTEPAEDAFRCDGAERLACDVPEPCPSVLSRCDRPNPDMYACMASEHTYDADAMTCVLDGLLAGTPGAYTIARDNEICGLEGCGVRRTRIIVDVTQTALEVCDADPVGAGDVESGTTSLPQSDLMECADQPDPDRLTCVLATLALQAPLCTGQ